MCIRDRIILYTAFNLSLAVWLMKGFIDEIPRAYEESALVDGYSRGSAFFRIILPHARTGMAVTAVFCLISAWNEFGFAMTLNNAQAVTVPVYFAGLQGNTNGVPWPQIAAGARLFVPPIDVFTVLVRHHLLLGPSGCGKTTTLRMVAGLEIATGGRIELAGSDVTTLRPSLRDVGFVFQ